jgi:hypothetical protein
LTHFYPVSTRVMFEQLFEGELCLLENQVCKQCDAQIRHPLLPWLVGQKFFQSEERVLFVGKPHRGIPGPVLKSGLIEPTVDKDFLDRPWPYWRYTRNIAENLYGERAFDFIAMTNIIKCTNVDSGINGKRSSSDRTTFTMAESCISKLRVIWREITLLEPRTVIFYTFGLYRKLLIDIPVALPNSIEEATPPSHFVLCRNKRLGWWERSCESAWTQNLRLLVVGDPERMAQREYVQLLSDWIRPKKRSE